jgi:hypothetical protein
LTALGVFLLVIACAGVPTMLLYDGADWNQYFYRDLARLKAGQIDGLYLYCTRDSDALLRQIQGMPEVESLRLQLADATDDGMRYVATLPNLRELVLYGGRPGISDRGLAHVVTCASLEAVSLVNTRVTDKGLSALEKLPALSSLTLYRDSFREQTLTDNGLAHLKSCPNLRSLALTGGWVTDAGMAKLTGIHTLRSLHLESARVTDATLRDLKELRMLESLDVRGTQISNAGIGELERLLPELHVVK